jgi:hypothetical protein
MRSRFVCTLALAVFLFLAAAGPASAFGWRRAVSSSYYYSAPVVYVAAYPVLPCPPVPVVSFPVAPAVAAPPAQLYAAPQPAPPSPSSSAEPPLAPRSSSDRGLQGAVESRRPGPPPHDTYYVARRATVRETPERCAVTFWNMTGRNVTLTVNGQAYTLPAGDSLKLPLGRQFVWNVSGRETKQQVVPPEEVGVEIVLRG